MKPEEHDSISVHQCQEIESLFSHQSLEFIPDGRNILLFQSTFHHMPDRCPTDRPINILKFGGINVPGRIEVFFDPFLCFKDYLIGYEEVDDDTCYDPDQAGGRQKD